MCTTPSRTRGGCNSLPHVRPETSVGAGPARRDDRSPANVPGEDTAPSSRQVLRFLATVLRARAAVEIGTAAEGTCATVRGMAEDGVLTSIDVDPQAQRRARQALSQADIPHSRVRLISGAAREVLPRLTEGGYDLVTVRTATTEPAEYLDLGVRLLRPGGVVVFDGVRVDGAGAVQEHPTTGARELLGAVRAQDELVPVALPVGTGMFAVAKST